MLGLSASPPAAPPAKIYTIYTAAAGLLLGDRSI